MSKETLGPELRMPNGDLVPTSLLVRSNGFLFVAGTMGTDENAIIVPGGIEAQTRQCLKNIDNILSLAGAGLNDVVKATCWITDLEDFQTFNRVYAEIMGPAFPARATVISSFVLPGSKLEIEVMARDPAA